MSTMIILYSNHQCGLDDSNNLEKYRDDPRVSMLLIPVNNYAPEYVIVYPDTLPKKFELLQFEYNLSIEYFGDDGYYYQTCDSQTVVCKTLVELIQFVYSIYKLHGFNMLNTQDDFEVYHVLTLEHMRVFRKGKKRSDFWDLNSELVTESAPEFTKLVEVLNKLINGNSEKDIIPPVSIDTPIFMNTKKGKWSTNEGDKHNLRSIALMDFNSVTFISDEDIELLSKIDSPLLSQISFSLIVNEEDIPYDDFTSKRIYNDLDMEYLEMHHDTETHLYGVDSIVEAIINLPYIVKCRNILDTVTLGFCNIDEVIELRFSIKGKYGKKNETRSEYYFSLRGSKMEDKDYYDDFMIFLTERIKLC